MNITSDISKFILQNSISNETKYSEQLRKDMGSSKLCQGVSISMCGNSERYFSPVGEEYGEDQESEKWHDDSSKLVHLVLRRKHFLKILLLFIYLFHSWQGMYLFRPSVSGASSVIVSFFFHFVIE